MKESTKKLNPKSQTPYPLILAIETSCDETAVAITQGDEVISSVVASQIKDHKPFGGVVPELASRKHVTALNYLIDVALKEAGMNLKDIDAVAVTKGPGLVGALMVGMSAAKTLSLALDKPLITINHLEAHIYSIITANSNLKTPVICLIVSGGHTMLVLVKEFGKYKILGSTIDDAAGEAFDKVAKFLGLSYPGGPEIEKISKLGNEGEYDFPRPLKGSQNFNFSFSGLKTAIIYKVRRLKENDIKYEVADVAASFQKAVVDVLLYKTFKAAEEHNVKNVAIVGGVSSNNYLRNSFIDFARSSNKEVYLPDKELSTDNAAMVGLAAKYYYNIRNFSSQDETVNPNWHLPVVENS